jgi:hypothetical protein
MTIVGPFLLKQILTMAHESVMNRIFRENINLPGRLDVSLRIKEIVRLQLKCAYTRDVLRLRIRRLSGRNDHTISQLRFIRINEPKEYFNYEKAEQFTRF